MVRCLTCMWLFMAVTVTHATSAYSKIIPGEAMGPVRLGMTEREAHVAAYRLAAQYDCNVDIAISKSHVAAIGTRDGGCLDLLLPNSLGRRDMDDGPKVSPTAFGIGIGGSIAALLYAFGPPIRFVQLQNDAVAVIWRQGLITRAGSMSSPTGGTVTYLAVVPPRTASLPVLFPARVGSPTRIAPRSAPVPPRLRSVPRSGLGV